MNLQVRACARTGSASFVRSWLRVLLLIAIGGVAGGVGCSAPPSSVGDTDLPDGAVADDAADGEDSADTASASDSDMELTDPDVADAAPVADAEVDAARVDAADAVDALDAVTADAGEDISDAVAEQDSESSAPGLIGCLQRASYTREFPLPSEVNELSGLATARVDGAQWWMHNDSGGQPLLYGVDADEGVVTTRRFAESARDVEDMAAGLCGDGVSRCLYVADIGDNLAVHTSVRIHRVPEAGSGEVSEAEQMTLRYATGAVDAEAVFVRGQQVVVMTKEPGQSRVFAIDFEAGADVEVIEVATMSLAGLPAGGSELLTAADWRADSGLLLRTYTSVAWVPLAESAPLSELADALPLSLPVGLDLQGESIAWFDDGAGYFHAGEGQDVRSYAVRCESAPSDGSGPP